MSPAFQIFGIDIYAVRTQVTCDNFANAAMSLPQQFLIMIRSDKVRKVGNAIHCINHYPLNSAIGFSNIYPLDSDLSGG